MAVSKQTNDVRKHDILRRIHEQSQSIDLLQKDFILEKTRSVEVAKAKLEEDMVKLIDYIHTEFVEKN